MCFICPVNSVCCNLNDLNPRSEQNSDFVDCIQFLNMHFFLHTQRLEGKERVYQETSRLFFCLLPDYSTCLHCSPVVLKHTLRTTMTENSSISKLHSSFAFILCILCLNSIMIVIYLFSKKMFYKILINKMIHTHTHLYIIYACACAIIRYSSLSHS